METWLHEFEWTRVRHLVKDTLGITALPDLNAVLFLIGIQELGVIKPNFSKEEKQDLMHLGVCRLLSYDDYYEFVGRDDDGWPHYKLLARPLVQGERTQELLLKEKAIQYFQDWEKQAASLENSELEI